MSLPMTSRRNILGRVQQVADILRLARISRVLLSTLACFVSVWAAAALLDTFVELSVTVRHLVLPGAAFAASAILWLGRAQVRAVAVDRAALWIEERIPSLRYALVTAVDPLYQGRVPELDAQVDAYRYDDVARGVVWTAVRVPAATVLGTCIVLLLLPRGSVGRVARPAAGDALRRETSSVSHDPLATLVVVIEPPAYTALPSTTSDDPSSVRALVGSRVTLKGRRGSDGVYATVDSNRRAAENSDGRWQLSVTMPSAPAVLALVAGAHRRLLSLEPVADSAPAVLLVAPARDSILRRPSGSLALSAELSDDHGLASSAFEYIVSSGSGESFTFKSGTLGALEFAGARNVRGTISARLSIDALGMRAGDIVHVRAVARDRNTVSGPTLGVSETRTIRIARADEYDSVAVDAAPPPEPEKNALSQRMLLLMSQALEKKRRVLAKGPFVSESRAIALDQTRLRKRVGEIVFQRLGESGGEGGDALERRLDRPTNPDSVLAAADRATGATSGTALEGSADETPVVAVNRPLLEAYNFMWSASTELELGEPGRAIPWMQKALDRLQAARSAERIYLRGKVRAVVVDIAKVRLAGKDKGVRSVRVPRPAADPGRAQRLARFDAITGMTRRQSSAAADSLVLLRLELIDRDRGTAQALEAASVALRRGGDVTEAFIKARRALAGDIERRAGISLWGAP